MSMRWLIVWSSLATFSVAVGCQPSSAPGSARSGTMSKGVRKDRLGKPSQIHIALEGEPVNDVIYPVLADVDGDGAPDLLVGTRMKGRLLVYPNVRAATDHKLTNSQWFDDKVPSGRIPEG